MARDDLRDDERRDTPRRATSPGAAGRLDVPRDTRRRLVLRPDYDPEIFGKFAEKFARYMGTARFLAYMTVFVIIWIILNIVGIWGIGWDPYPFILLNLFFSTQASYAAPLILLAQNRQEARDRVVAEQDREANVRAHADMQFLAREVASLRMAIGEVSTRDFVRSELRNLLTELDDRAAHQREEPPSHKRDGPATPRSLDL
ncbi:MAG: DUF1003 domain-containing protein [Nocardioidaceae bacterium]|nr:DUF1003 domain-containing protein [Nocardioidaceae bacterium]